MPLLQSAMERGTGVEPPFVGSYRFLFKGALPLMTLRSLRISKKRYSLAVNPEEIPKKKLLLFYLIQLTKWPSAQWSEGRGLNPQHPRWQRGTLPIELPSLKLNLTFFKSQLPERGNNYFTRIDYLKVRIPDITLCRGGESNSHP